MQSQVRSDGVKLSNGLPHLEGCAAHVVIRGTSQLELAVVEYLGWFDNARLHQALGDLPPAEFEGLRAPQNEMTTPTMIKLETT